MTVPTIQFEALKVGYQQTKDGVKLVLVIHPQEVPDDLALSALGARYQCVLVRLGDDDQPQQPQTKQRSWDELKPSQQAGIACNDPRFVQWARGLGWSDAASFVRERCGIFSRAELDKEETAAERWKHLYGVFRRENGLEASPR